MLTTRFCLELARSSAEFSPEAVEKSSGALYSKDFQRIIVPRAVRKSYRSISALGAAWHCVALTGARQTLQDEVG